MNIELKYFYRTHWSLFPACFEGRKLPKGTYDELMGILVGGCMGTSMSGASFSCSRTKRQYYRCAHLKVPDHTIRRCYNAEVDQACTKS